MAVHIVFFGTTVYYPANIVLCMGCFGTLNYTGEYNYHTVKVRKEKIMNTIKVRDIEIGAGAPKIIVPIVGVTKDDIIAEAKTFDSIPVDMVEWRG